jgi:hypothetical protein
MDLFVSVRLAAAVLVVSLVPAALAAQANTDADTREVMAYRLTMPKLRQLNAVFSDIQRQREADPAYKALLAKKREVEALNAKDELTDAEAARLEQLEEEIAGMEDAEDEAMDADQSLSDLGKRMAADPHISAALKRAGLAPREAATLQLAWFQAAFTVGLLEAGTIKEIPKEVNTENVKFYQANRAEIAGLSALGNQKTR